jgi:hypothetical protein
MPREVEVRVGPEAVERAADASPQGPTPVRSGDACATQPPDRGLLALVDGTLIGDRLVRTGSNTEWILIDPSLLGRLQRHETRAVGLKTVTRASQHASIPL